MRKHRIHLGDEVYDLDHKIGDFVYARVNDSPDRGQVTGYYVQPGGLLMYHVTWSPDGAEHRHYGFELSTSAFVQDTADNDSTEEDESCPNESPGS